MVFSTASTGLLTPFLRSLPKLSLLYDSPKGFLPQGHGSNRIAGMYEVPPFRCDAVR